MDGEMAVRREGGRKKIKRKQVGKRGEEGGNERRYGGGRKKERKAGKKEIRQGMKVVRREMENLRRKERKDWGRIEERKEGREEGKERRVIQGGDAQFRFSLVKRFWKILHRFKFCPTQISDLKRFNKQETAGSPSQ